MYLGTNTVNEPAAKPQMNLATVKYQSLNGNMHMTMPTIIRRLASLIILSLPYLQRPPAKRAEIEQPRVRDVVRIVLQLDCSSGVQF